jgi:hypothetical protein
VAASNTQHMQAIGTAAAAAAAAAGAAAAELGPAIDKHVATSTSTARKLEQQPCTRHSYNAKRVGLQQQLTWLCMHVVCHLLLLMIMSCNMPLMWPAGDEHHAC